MPRRNNLPKIIRTPHVRRCQNKRRFTDEKIAKRAADDGMLIDTTLQLSVYRCTDCGGWHLTSRKK